MIVSSFSVCLISLKFFGFYNSFELQTFFLEDLFFVKYTPLMRSFAPVLSRAACEVLASPTTGSSRLA